jgi:hypothetical protein
MCQKSVSEFVGAATVQSCSDKSGTILFLEGNVG